MQQRLSKEELARLVYETQDAIVLNVRCLYVIDKPQLDTAEKILRWTIHLSDKNWMTKELLNYFFLTACHVARIKPYGI